MITAYIITDIHSQFSSNLARETSARLDQYQWQYKIWPAVNGFQLTDRDWLQQGISLLPRGKTIDRPGAWGCIHSHYTLWQHCLDINEPMVVLEHDALAQSSYPEELDLDQGVCKLWATHSLRRNAVTGTWSRGSWAYTLTPAQAESLVAFSRKYGVQALDKQLGSHAVSWHALNWDLFQHNPRCILSSTVLGIYLG
jgi:hypothetical protein